MSPNISVFKMNLSESISDRTTKKPFADTQNCHSTQPLQLRTTRGMMIVIFLLLKSKKPINWTLLFRLSFSNPRVVPPTSPFWNFFNRVFFSNLFGLYHQMEITVSVREAKGLAPKDPNGFSDPYFLIGVAGNVSGEFVDISKCIPLRCVLLITLILFINIFRQHSSL
jgi:hypothetical protein